MGKLLKGLWDSPKVQFDTLTGRDMRRKNKPLKKLSADSKKKMTPEQKADYLAREKAKGDESTAWPEGSAITNTPLTERYS